MWTRLCVRSEVDIANQRIHSKIIQINCGANVRKSDGFNHVVIYLENEKKQNLHRPNQKQDGNFKAMFVVKSV